VPPQRELPGRILFGIDGVLAQERKFLAARLGLEPGGKLAEPEIGELVSW
jgi:hypothetical protein